MGKIEYRKGFICDLCGFGFENETEIRTHVSFPLTGLDLKMGQAFGVSPPFQTVASPEEVFLFTLVLEILRPNIAHKARYYSTGFEQLPDNSVRFSPALMHYLDSEGRDFIFTELSEERYQQIKSGLEITPAKNFFNPQCSYLEYLRGKRKGFELSRGILRKFG